MNDIDLYTELAHDRNVKIPARIHELQFGEDLHIGLWKQPAQRYQRRLSYTRQHRVLEVFDGVAGDGHATPPRLILPSPNPLFTDFGTEVSQGYQR